MKNLILILVLFSSTSLLAKDFKLASAKAIYTVKHLMKTVKGRSEELKGKMVCDQKECEFLIAVPAKSFVSSDSNRDLNMQTILDVARFPLVTAKGKFPATELEKSDWTLKSLISIHGVEKEYLVKIKKSQMMEAHFNLKLEDHKIERPSLLTFKIENEVPMDFEIHWAE